MLSTRKSRFVYLLVMAAAMVGLLVLAVVLFRQGLAAGPGEALMLGWMLVFTLALPLGLLLLPVAAALAARLGHSTVIPPMGEKVP